MSDYEYTAVITGGQTVLARSTGYVEEYLSAITYRHQLNPDYNPFPRDSFIPNLIIAVMEESDAVYLLKKVHIPPEFYCPTRLHQLTQQLALNAQQSPNDVPEPPKHGIIIAFADSGIYPRLLQYKDIFIGVEKYYAEVYEYIITLNKK